MNKVSSILWGLLLIIVGIIFGLNALGITDINLFFRGWWTLIIIIPCFINLFKDNDKVGNIIGIFIGLSLLLVCQGLVDFLVISRLIVPFILIIIGMSFIFKDAINNRVKKEIKKLNKNIDSEYYATFSSQNINFKNEEFTGANLNSIFGGIKLNLKEAIIDNDVVIGACSVFGGITIYAPKDVNVKISSTSIFGGVSDKRKNKESDFEKTIYINASCIFGGVEIR